MSKITQYLNEHLLGEVTSNDSVREQFSCDGSILRIKPEMVISPRITNDIRKVARFTWQLAEKGQVIPITTRGGGSDKTGASIGKGIIINTLAHLNKIIYVSTKSKDQFVHVQPGVNFRLLNETLKSHGLIIPSYPNSADYSTVGGSVANNYRGPLSGNFGSVGDAVKRLEVVLSNGDIIETIRINKHELDKKKGLQTFEGELYRKIDGIIEDGQTVIDEKIAKKPSDNTVHSGIAKVKQRDGSFDLTPLLIGSQGTLGIISEIVLKTDFNNLEESIIVTAFDNPRIARDAANQIIQLSPVSLDYLDGSLFEIANKNYGKKYILTDKNPDKTIGAVLYICFNDFSEGARRRKVKQTLKKLTALDTSVNIFTNNEYSNEELIAIREVNSVILQPEHNGESYPPLIDGSSISIDKREEFIVSVKELADKHHIDLPLQINWLNGIINTRALLQLHAVSDKQRAFKLITDYMQLVAQMDGCMLADSSEGRLKVSAVNSQLDDDVIKIYEQVREAFDPFGTLNPGVKQKSDLKSLISQLNPDYSLADFAKYSPKS